MATYPTSVEFQDNSEGREKRRKWVDEHRVEVIASTKATLNDVKEAENTFIDAYYLSSFAVWVITIDQILHEKLPENQGHERPCRWKISSKSLLLNELLTPSSRIAYERLTASDVLNSIIGENETLTTLRDILQRMDEKGKSPVDIRGSDAKKALRCLYRVERIAKRDIDPNKLSE